MHLQAHKVCMHHCTDGENSQGQSSLSLEKNDAHGAIGASLDVGEYVSAYLDDYMWCDVLYCKCISPTGLDVSGR